MKKLLFILSGILLLSCNRVTELPEVITSNAIVTDSGIFLTAEVSFTGGDRNTTRGFCWSESPNPTIINADFLDDGKGLGVYSTMIDGLEEYTTYYVRSFADNKAGKAYGNELSFTTGLFNLGNAYFDSKGCLICDNYEIGEQFSLNGNVYTVAGDGMLNSLKLYPSTFCTSKVTSLYEGNNITSFASDKLDDIGHWDVSSVTNMSYLFYHQPTNYGDYPYISNWDVSSVTNMSWMFSTVNSLDGNPSLNNHVCDLSQWDVSNVVNMDNMFYNNISIQNQDLSQWCVSNFTSEPNGFAPGNLIASKRPKWGTCP